MGNYDDGTGFDRDECGCAYVDPTEKALGDQSFDWTKAHTSGANKAWLRSLAPEIRFEAEGRRYLLVHGSPRRINEYLYEHRGVLCGLGAPPAGAADEAAILRQACELLAEAIGHLEQPSDLRVYPARLHALETQGDALVRSNVQRLFDGASDVRPVLIGQEIYRGLEDAIDRTDRPRPRADCIGQRRAMVSRQR